MKLDERRAGRPPTSAAVAAQWFAQDLFEGAEDDDDDEQPAVPRLQRGKRTVASPGAHYRACTTSPGHCRECCGAQA